jgi:hypothetical protein
MMGFAALNPSCRAALERLSGAGLTIYNFYGLLEPFPKTGGIGHPFGHLGAPRCLLPPHGALFFDVLRESACKELAAPFRKSRHPQKLPVRLESFPACFPARSLPAPHREFA